MYPEVLPAPVAHDSPRGSLAGPSRPFVVLGAVAGLGLGMAAVASRPVPAWSTLAVLFLGTVAGEAAAAIAGRLASRLVRPPARRARPPARAKAATGRAAARRIVRLLRAEIVAAAWLTAAALCVAPLALLGLRLAAHTGVGAPGLRQMPFALAGLLALGMLAARPATVAASRRPRATLLVLVIGGALAWITLIDRDAAYVERDIDKGAAGSAGLQASGPVARAISTAPASARRPNLVLVVLDTTRADHLSPYGYARDTTPVLSQLARSSTLYLDAISPAPWTLPAHASLFTGQFPTVHGATAEHLFLGPEFVTLAELLRAGGYATVGLTSNSSASAAYGLDQGFEDFFEVFRVSGARREQALQAFLPESAALRLAGQPGFADKGAAFVNRSVSTWLDRRERRGDRRPFFLFVNYLEAHLPYLAPEPHRSRFVHGSMPPDLAALLSPSWMPTVFQMIGARTALGSRDAEFLTALYDGGLAYQDMRLGELVGDLSRRGLMDDTVLVVVADHGENLGEHGLLDHVFSVHQTLLHVPLLVRYPPRFTPGLRYEGLVSTMSVFPTLLELAGIGPDPAWPPPVGPLPRAAAEPALHLAFSTEGLRISELELLANEVAGVDARPYAIRHLVVQNQRWKFVSHPGGVDQLFDLRTDPGETLPLDPATRPEGVALERALAAWAAAQAPRDLAAHPQLTPLDAQTRESLRSLGYLE